MSFNSATLGSYTVGELIKLRREELGLGLNNLAQDTTVAAKYLTALEEGRYTALPGDIYAKNFVRLIAKELGFPADALVSQYLAECAVTAKVIQDEPVVKSRKMNRSDFRITPKILKTGLALGVLALIFSYLGIRLNSAITPPNLTVDSPDENFVTSEKTIAVSGSTDSEVQVFINGVETYSDQNGFFSEDIEFQPGVATISITAKKKRSKESVITRNIMVTE